jgi:hypothetical protein
MAKKKQAEALKPLMGEVIVIMGIPKSNDFEARTIIPTIAEAVTNAYDNIDIIKINDVDLNAPTMYAAKEGDQEMIDYVNTGEGKATMALLMREYQRDRANSAIEERGHFESMSPEQQERARKHLRRVILDSKEADEKRRAEAVLHAFDIAQKWSSTPELTPRERVHGAVRDLYDHYGETRGTDAKGRSVEVKPGRDYDKHFELHFAEDIKMRTIRAAKDLFGTKKEGA